MFDIIISTVVCIHYRLLHVPFTDKSETVNAFMIERFTYSVSAQIIILANNGHHDLSVCLYIIDMGCLYRIIIIILQIAL